METPVIASSRPLVPVMAKHRPVAAGISIGTGILFVMLAGGCPDLADYAPWSGQLTDIDGLARWLLSAWTEPEFYTSVFAGTGLLIGALLANYLDISRSRKQGFGLACGSGLWPWTVASSALGFVLSDLAWGWTLRSTGLWQPTFVPVVSIAPTLVLVYGAGWRPALSGAVLSALLVTPLSIAATHLICRPFNLPLVTGVTGGMAAGACLTFAVCGFLPWLSLHPAQDAAAETPQTHHDLSWALRRILADFSEAQFFGNEWASAGLILGALLALLLAPGTPVYGSGLLLAVLTGQLLSGATAMALWYRKWVRHGFYPTFVPIVSVVPAAILALNGSALSILGSALLGAAMAPPLAAAISAKLPVGFHPFIGNVASMAISTAVIVPVLGLIHAVSGL